MRYYVETIGCFKNSVDSEMLIHTLSKQYEHTNDYRKADLIIVNSCAFIERAKQESQLKTEMNIMKQ